MYLIGCLYLVVSLTIDFYFVLLDWLIHSMAAPSPSFPGADDCLINSQSTCSWA